MADYLNIAGRVRTTAADGVVAEAQEIKDLLKNKSQQEINADVDNELGDRYTKEETYSKEQLDDLITTPDVNYVSVVATDATTAVTDVLPATGEANTIYRVGNWNGTQYDPTMYALFAWNGSAYVCLAVRSFVGEVYDISANHPDGQGNPTPYADLSAALGTDGANIPADIRRGGMSIKFIQGTVQSSDNKYVQYFCNSQTFTTDITAWEKINLEEEVSQLDKEVYGENGYTPKMLSLTDDAYYGTAVSGTVIAAKPSEREGTSYVVLTDVSAGDKFKIYGKGTTAIRLYAFTNSTGTILSASSGSVNYRENGEEITAPVGTTKLYINFLDYSSSTDKLEEYYQEPSLSERISDLEDDTIKDSDIADNLTTSDATKVLSAKQGKILQDGKVNIADVVDNLTTDNATKPLSAKQGKLLNEKIEGSAAYVPQTLTLEADKYWANVASHTYVNDVMSSREGTKCCVISSSAGDKYKIFGKGSNNIKLYAFTDSTRLILLSNTTTINTRTDGEVITAPEGTTNLYINFLDYDATSDKLEKYVVVEGLEDRVEDLENEERVVQVYGGMKIIAFGDSITEFKNDGTGGDNKGWVDHAAEMLGCEFVNVAIGGAHMNVRNRVEVFDSTHEYAVNDFVFYKPSTTMNIYRCINAHTGAWTDADFQDETGNDTVMGGAAYNPLFCYDMIKAFCDVDTTDAEERFKNQIAAAECIYTWKSSHDDNRAIIQRLVDTNPADISAIVLLHGANDYATYGYWGTSGSFDTTTLLGAINQSVKLLNGTYKDKPIFFVTPPVRWFGYSGGEGEVENFSDYYKKDENAPKTYKGFVYEILANEYKLNHIPVCDLYGELQWTMWNFSNYFPSNDGTHPRPGFNRIGAKIASFLLANNVLKPLTD